MRISKILQAVVVTALLVSGASQVAAAPSDADTIRELTALSNAWDKAIVTHDLAGIEGNMAPDFKQVRGNGMVVNRADFIRDINDPSLKIDPYVVEDFNVHLLGDTALLYGRIRMTGEDEGKRFQSHFRYIDIYVRRGGKWKVVSVQVTPMPADKK
ncbi:MAG: nuclear transport factor 2 family protein [Betaproteobacteria bacterium]